MPNRNKRGMILPIVIWVILAVVVLSAVILRIVSNQTRLTHHQVSRIQAQYAAKAGMVYALEMLRTGVWGYSVSSAVNTCVNSGDCPVSDPSFPSAVVGQQVQVIFCPSGSTCGVAPNSHTCNPPTGSDFCIYSTVDFTYTP